jgi:hypothetical protein
MQRLAIGGGVIIGIADFSGHRNAPVALSRQAAAGSRPNPRPCMAGSGLTRAVWEAKALLEELAS